MPKFKLSPTWLPIYTPVRSGRTGKRKDGLQRRNSRLAKDRDNWRCQRCGALPGQRGRMESHHRDHDALNNKLSNLETLCRECHLAHHHRLQVDPERAAWRARKAEQ